MLRLLSGARPPLDSDLVIADGTSLLAMAELREAFKSYLSLAIVKSKNPSVTASKLCARKRPGWFPVG